MNIFKRFNPQPARDPKSKRKQEKRHERHSTRQQLRGETKRQG